jgi:hypothetical protein
VAWRGWWVGVLADGLGGLFNGCCRITQLEGSWDIFVISTIETLPFSPPEQHRGPTSFVAVVVQTALWVALAWSFWTVYSRDIEVVPAVLHAGENFIAFVVLDALF